MAAPSMLIATRSLRCARALSRSGQCLLANPAGRQLHATFGSFATGPARHDDTDGKTPAPHAPRQRQQLDTNADVVADPYANEDPIELYVRSVREQWGENLPEGLLSTGEYRIYQRYYGPPVRTLSPEEVAAEASAEPADLQVEGLASLEDSNGVCIEFDAELVQEEEMEVDAEGEGDVPDGFVRVRSPKEAKMYARLREDIRRSLSAAERDWALEEEEEERTEVHREGEHRIQRMHPLTQLGWFGTFPGTTVVPASIIRPTAALLSTVNNKHLDDAVFRILGPALGKTPVRTKYSDNAYNAIPLDTSHGMGDMEANVYMATILPGYYAQSLSALTELRRRLGRDWILGSEHDGGGEEKGVKLVLDVGTGGAGVLAWRAIVEAERQLRQDEANEIDGVDNKTEEPTTPADASEETPTPAGQKAVVVMGSQALRHRMAKILENTTFIPRLPDVATLPTVSAGDHTFEADIETDVDHEAEAVAQAAPEVAEKQPRKLYDLIIATNTILPIHESHERKSHIQRLWSLLNPQSGVLLLVEKGTSRGFEAIAGARKSLLKYNISTADSEFVPLKETEDVSAPRTRKETSSIVAPCTNHAECPLYVNGPAKSISRDICSFSQRYQWPTYMQRILGAKTRNHEDLIYSYVAVRRGVDVTRQGSPPIDPKIDDFDTTVSPPVSQYSLAQLRAHAYTLPRAIFPPMKRAGHVIIDVCTAQGKIERWVVPQSYGKIAFRDARKSKWGDLWALDAKSKFARNIRLGDKQKTRKATVAPTDGKKGNKREDGGKTNREKKLWRKREAGFKKERGKRLTLEREAQRLIKESADF